MLCARLIQFSRTPRSEDSITALFGVKGFALIGLYIGMSFSKVVWAQWITLEQADVGTNGQLACESPGSSSSI